MDKENRQASADEIEITEEMIEAGIAAYERWYARGGQEDFDLRALVRGVLESALYKADATLR